jgi:recombination protein RecT
MTKVAMSNRQSVVNAVTNIAAIGISLNPAKRQAYLVPRDSKVCLDISYIGLMDLAMATGSILWAQGEVVYANDSFALNGFDRPPGHNRDPFSEDRGEIRGVYVVVKTPDGDYLTETMSVKEVNDIRDRSSAWKAYIDKKKSCPWVTDWSEMAKKTVVKRAYKYWPKSDRLDNAIHYLNTEAGQGINMGEAQRAEPEGLPHLSDDGFNAGFSKLRAAIESGRKTAEGIILTMSSKYVLSESQKKHLRDVKKTEGETVEGEVA